MHANDTKPSAETPPVAQAELWGTDEPRELAEGEALIVDVDGFEGPLDLLLAMARTQKVDLLRISILALVEQYLSFIAAADKIRLELAADYLVMAAWLAYLKSRLLLPKDEQAADEPSGEELARRLAFRLARLGAMRQAAATLLGGSRLGQDYFERGMPKGVRTLKQSTYVAEVYDLLKAYAELRNRTVKRKVTIRPRTVWSIKQAREHLERLLGRASADWVALETYLVRYLPPSALTSLAPEEQRRTALAASFGASLEMAREGLIELRQASPFAPIYLKRRAERVGSDRFGGGPKGAQTPE